MAGTFAVVTSSRFTSELRSDHRYNVSVISDGLEVRFSSFQILVPVTWICPFRVLVMVPFPNIPAVATSPVVTFPLAYQAPAAPASVGVEIGGTVSQT